jgi:hypothetical protein
VLTLLLSVPNYPLVIAMSYKLGSKPQKFTKSDHYAALPGLPERVEFADGEIGPYSDKGKLTLLANWGADEVIRLTGREVWREALAALPKESEP